MGGDLMAWIAVHEQLDGAKLRQLKKEIGCSKYEAIGILVTFWLWGLDNADRDGKIKYADQNDIAEIFAFGLTEKINAKFVVQALIKTNWIDIVDDVYVIHDWNEWQELWYKALEKREKDRIRKRKKLSENPVEFPPTARGNSLENPSQPSPSPSSSPIPSTSTKQSTESYATKETYECKKTPTHTRTRIVKHAYGEYGWIQLSDEEYERLKIELGEEELKRCITYIDESAQSNGNKNKWKDWNLVIRKCSRNRWGLNQNSTNVKPSASAGAMDDIRALHEMYSQEGEQ